MTIPTIPMLVRSSPTFETDVNTFFASQFNAFSTAMEAARLEILASGASALASAATASASVGQIAAYANAPAFTPGTYAQNFVVHAANRRLYYKLTASSAVSTDPASDPTNWGIVSPLLVLTTEQRGTAAISAGVLTLDLSNGVVSVPLTSNISSIAFTNNVASAVACQALTLETTGDGTQRTVAWPAGNGTTTLLFKWPGGVAPTPTATAGKRDTWFFKSVSQFLWDAYVVGQAT